MSERTARKAFEEVSLCDGKYLFRLNLDNWHLTCLRHGGEWREFVGDKAVHALFDRALEVEELKEEIRRLKVDKEDYRQRAVEWEEYYIKERNRRVYFEETFRKTFNDKTITEVTKLDPGRTEESDPQSRS